MLLTVFGSSRIAPPPLGVIRVGPAVEIQHVPEMLDRQPAEVGDHGDEDAFHAIVVQRARQMVMVGEIGLPSGPR